MASPAPRRVNGAIVTALDYSALPNSEKRELAAEWSHNTRTGLIAERLGVNRSTVNRWINPAAAEAAREGYREWSRRNTERVRAGVQRFRTRQKTLISTYEARGVEAYCEHERTYHDAALDRSLRRPPTCVFCGKRKRA